MNTPSIKEFKRWSRENASLARAVCLAQAFAECERERVDAYVRPIFERYAFQLAGKWNLSGPVEKLSDLYLCEDERLPEFYEELDKAHRLHGFTGPHGHCPALVAEMLLVNAQNALLASGCALMGIEREALYGENRRKMLDLLMGAALKSARELA